ncbi:hypothetical protein B0H66DRAFT_475418 [Apodospora peruviana]|uniref:Rab-GAP TBC domain-containing protein n=1 Tax=Apodospora peruviana TaxID=516989 RepID=A0AAE0I565_9PEZI|nr:hypothetical protein B0H66DRAFT_475418 [Apodospora peruviana]
MSAESADSPAGGAGHTAVGRQHSLRHRELGLWPSSAHSRHQRPQKGPWSEHGDAAASEPFHHDRNHHREHNLHHVVSESLEFSDAIRPSSPSKHPRELISEVPVLSPIPISPRWDSLFSNRSTATYKNSSSVGRTYQQTSQRTRAESTPTRRPSPRSAFPGLSSNPFIPEELDSAPPLQFKSRQFPLVGRQNDSHRPPVTPTSAASSFDDSSPGTRRTTPTEGNMTVENFSRPRKPSIRSHEGPMLRQLPTSHEQTEESGFDQPTTTQIHINYSTPPNPWPRNRGGSSASAKSSSTFSSIPNRPSNDHLSVASRTGSLRRPSPSSTSTTGNRAWQALSPNNNNGQATNREVPPWMGGGDETRSSFRSQLTASTAQGTLFTASGTERSSVLTKTSSITEHSIINGYARTSWRTNSMADDGPSLEDVMGMYERGFNDSDIESIRRSMRFAEEDEDVYEMDAGPEDFALQSSRPASSHSDVSGMGAKMLEAMNDPLPIPGAIPVPESRRRSVVRQSGINFRFSLLPNSLPKDMGLGFGAEDLSKRKELDTDGLGKHDSAKMLDRDDDQTTQRPEGSKPASPTTPAPLVTHTSPSENAGELPPSRPVTPAPAVQYPVEPLEEPGSRDRYGFRKVSNNVSRQEYDAWDSSYTDYLSRRRKKWVAYLKDNSLLTDNPNRFPPRNAKTKRFIRKGIPPDWRGAAWFYYAGGPAILSKHRGVYDDLVKRAGLEAEGPGKIAGKSTEVKPLVVEDIEKDLHRTFPDNVRFKPPRTATAPGDDGHPSSQGSPWPSQSSSEPKIIGSLRRVLHAFALYNPRIGYCQSLNFLAGMLLLFVETEEQSFWLLNIITRVYLPGTHEMSLEGSKVDLGVLMLALKDSLPNVWKQIGGDEAEPGSGKKSRTKRGRDKSAGAQVASDPNRLPAITLCMTAWFMSCFIGTLPTETVLRVWDVFFYEGSRTLFRIALTIFKLAENEIKAVADPMEMFGVVQAFPRRLIDCNALMEACYRRRNGIGHLSQEVVEEARQERRAGIRKWKAEQEAAAAASDNNNSSMNVGDHNPGSSSATAAAGLDLAGDPEVHRKGTLFGRRKKDREQVRAVEVI